MKLIGYVDGVEVRFDFYPPDKFKADIPRHLDGTYIIQLKAIDDAGNETNYSNIFVRIDFKQLRAEILPSNYEFVSNGDDVGYKKLTSNYNVKELNNFSFKVDNLNNYSYRELVI